MKADLPENEIIRLENLHLYNILDTLPEQVFDDLTLVASNICQTPISVVSFVDENRQWFKSIKGLDVSETPRDIAFCAHAILQKDTMIIPNADLDPRFYDNPLVTNGPKIKYYAGTPLISREGFALGTLCVVDTVPRELTETQINALEALSRQVMTQIENRLNIINLEITKKQLEEKIANEQEIFKIIDYERNKLSSLFINAPAAICLLEGPDHVFKFSNSAYYDVIGKRDILGKSVREALPEINHQEIYKLLDSVYSSGVPYIGNEVSILIDKNSNGILEQLYIDFVYQPIFDTNNQVEGISVFIFNVTEKVLTRKKIEKLYKEVKDSNDSLKNFAHIASHDLQEPLRSVSSYTQLLSRRYKHLFDKDANEFMEYILDGSQRMKTLIENTLEYSKIRITKKEVESINLNKTIQHIKHNLMLVIEDNNVTITSDNLPVIKAENTHMMQLFQNIISNSIKYSRENVLSVIHISSEIQDNQWLFSVKDNGIGIDKEYYERIFEIFERLHSRSEYQGTGIGLANCKKIVELYGGKIWVESVEDQGSIFYFTMPIK